MMITIIQKFLTFSFVFILIFSLSIATAEPTEIIYLNEINALASLPPSLHPISTDENDNSPIWEIYKQGFDIDVIKSQYKSYFESSNTFFFALFNDNIFQQVTIIVSDTEYDLSLDSQSYEQLQKISQDFLELLQQKSHDLDVSINYVGCDAFMGKNHNYLIHKSITDQSNIKMITLTYTTIWAGKNYQINCTVQSGYESDEFDNACLTFVDSLQYGIESYSIS